MNEFIIDDDNFQQFCQPKQSGLDVTFGLTTRDYSKNPVGSYEFGQSFEENYPLIPRDEWPERCAEIAATKSSLFDLQYWPVLDQNGQGFCWSYSTTACVMLLREAMGLPHERLSPHAVACKIYGFQDRGAWGAVSFDFICKNGVPSDAFWPQKSMSRQYDNADTWSNALRHRITEGFIDLNPPHPADADMTVDQVVTCLLNRIPCVGDFNWWGHSVCLASVVDLKPQLKQQGLNDPNRWGIKGPNSWTPNWGDNGWFVLTGSKAIPDGGCAPRVVTAA